MEPCLLQSFGSFLIGLGSALLFIWLFEKITEKPYAKNNPKIHLHQLDPKNPTHIKYLKGFLLDLFKDEAFLQEFLSHRQKWLQSKKTTEEPKQ